jgi:uncharacterized lipoprotein YajG
MKTLIILTAVVLLSGCAENRQYIVNVGGLVICHGTVDKPVSVSTPVTADGNHLSGLP